MMQPNGPDIFRKAAEAMFDLYSYLNAQNSDNDKNLDCLDFVCRTTATLEAWEQVYEWGP